MRKLCYKIIIFAAVLMGSSLIALNVHAETENPIDVAVSVNGGDVLTVRGIDVGYADNNYISILDIQKLFAGTEKEFVRKIGDGQVNVVMTADREAVADKLEGVELRTADDNSREVRGWNDAERSSFTNKPIAINELKFNGEDRRYYTVVTNVDGYNDCFMSICDLCLMLDVDAWQDGTVVRFDTSSGMRPVNPMELEQQGFFESVNGVLVGDATTGEILYGYNAQEVYPIASTTKLMTYLLVAEAIEQGRIGYEDMVTIPKISEEIANTSDGLISMKEGQQATVKELIEAALIISSNEADHALSEYVAGDEVVAVIMMNEAAAKLSMDTARFYNCNGLPIYSGTLVPAKKQNRMSSVDMFKLASHLLNNYPQIKEVTSIKRTKMNAYDKELRNTNPVLYNMSEVTGLKTGTTNRSGACLVVSLEVNDGNENHDIVVVTLGAESSQDRGRISELMARYGKAVIEGNAPKYSDKSLHEEKAIVTSGDIVNLIVSKTIQKYSR